MKNILTMIASVMLVFAFSVVTVAQTPNVTIFLLGPDNSIRTQGTVATGTNDVIDLDVRWAGLNRQFFVNIPNENLIGIDVRPADGQLYGVTDVGRVYTINTVTGIATLLSGFQPAFAGGNQSLMDFNPVVDAIRLIGGNDTNFAVVKNAGGLFGVTAVQTGITYAPNDVNFGSDPNLVGGTYTNNVNGATTTIFYGLDFNLNVLTTIAVGANGSSNTGGGQLTTVGRLVDRFNNVKNVHPTADIDIVTINGANFMFGISGNDLFNVDMTRLVIGQPVFTTSTLLKSGGFIDIAVKNQVN